MLQQAESHSLKTPRGQRLTYGHHLAHPERHLGSEVQLEQLWNNSETTIGPIVEHLLMTIWETYLCLVGSIWPVYITMRLLMSPERFGWFCEKMFNFSFCIQKSETFAHSRSSSSAPVVEAKPEMFVLFRPAPLSWIFQAAFLSVMGTRGWRVSRPTTQPLNLPLFAPKTSRPPFLPWEPRGWVLWGNFLSRDKMQSGQEVWQVGGWDILPVSENNIEKRLRSEIMLFVLCLTVGVAGMSREKMCILESRLTERPSQSPKTRLFLPIFCVGA